MAVWVSHGLPQEDGEPRLTVDQDRFGEPLADPRLKRDDHNAEERRSFRIHREAEIFSQRLLPAEPITYGWTWDRPVAGRHGEVVWFVALGQAILEGEGAPPPAPYRLSGVLVQVSGRWRFALFNGAQPVPEQDAGHAAAPAQRTTRTCRCSRHIIAAEAWAVSLGTPPDATRTVRT